MNAEQINVWLAQLSASLAQAGAQLAERTADWTLYHWAATIFVAGMGMVLTTALVDELRYSKSLVGRFFIVCATVAVLLFAWAAYTQVAQANGWRWL